MKKINKKAFTIIELVVVIAIIAVLAGVLIPTFANLVKRANISSDTQLVRNLNTALALDNKEHKTMQSALDAAEEGGFDVARISSKILENKILWDSKNDVFCYLNNGEIEYVPNSVTDGDKLSKDDYKLWIISDVVDTTYSTYLYGYTGGSTIEATKGLDVGKTEGITAINYSNDGNEQKVVIRTNGGTLTINADKDEVTHYGQVDYVDIIAVKSSSYEERGTTSLIKVAKGNVALSSESKVGEIHFAKTGDVFTDIKVTLENGAKLPDLSRDKVGENLANDILVCEVVTSGTSEYYWLTGNATIEDEKVLVSTDKAGTNKVAATAENSTAVAIANAKSGETVIDNGATVKPASEMSAEELLQATASGAAKTFAEINSKEKLLAFRDAWNAGKLATGTFKLTANIDISGEDWLPIGTWEYPFNGTFDGNGKTIIGLTKIRLASEDVYSEGSSTKYNGVVFGFIAIAGGGDVEVKNLTLSNVNISLSSAANSGALIGYIPAHKDFTANSKGGEYWSETETSGKKVLPVNYGKDDVTLTNVSVSGSISAKQHIGGLIGKAYNTGDISVTDCSFIGDVTISATTGGAAGIIGWPSGYSTISVKGCTVEGNIKGGTPNKGTLVGKLDSISKNTVLDRNTTSNAHVINATDVKVPQNFTVNYEYNSDGSVKTVTVNGTSIPYNTQEYENCVVYINTSTYYTLTDCEVYNSAFGSYVKIYGNTTFDNCSFVYFNNHTSNNANELWQVEMTNTTFTNYAFRVKNDQKLTLNNNVKFTFKPNASGNTDYYVSGSNNDEKQANSYHVRVCNGGYLNLNESYSYETVVDTTSYYTNYNEDNDNGFLVYLEKDSYFNGEIVNDAHFILVTTNTQ